MFEIFALPFMQRALIGGSIVAVLLGWVGVFATSRNMSFIGAGIAHASLSSVALAILLGLPIMPTILLFALVFAIILYSIEKKTSVSRDMSIGIMFSVGMALGVLLLQLTEGYVPELMSFLFGSILAVKTSDLYLLIGISAILFLILIRYRSELLFVIVDPEGANLSGVNRKMMEVLIYILTSLAVVLSIKLVGIVLVSALLVIPSAIGRLWSNSFLSFQWVAILSSLITTNIGLLLSFYADLPAGAAIVVVATSFLFISWAILQTGVKETST